MATIQVVVTDFVEARTLVANLPDDIPVKRILPSLVGEMRLPSYYAWAELAGERFPTCAIHHKQSFRMLQSNETLSDAAVMSGDT